MAGFLHSHGEILPFAVVMDLVPAQGKDVASPKTGETREEEGLLQHRIGAWRLHEMPQLLLCQKAAIALRPLYMKGLGQTGHRVFVDEFVVLSLFEHAAQCGKAQVDGGIRQFSSILDMKASVLGIAQVGDEAAAEIHVDL